MPGSDLFTGTLDLLILKSLAAQPQHGYGIGRWIREHTDEVLDIQEGVIYPALYRLTRKQLLAEEWRKSETGREAKYYSLTRTGRAKLRTETERWLRHATAVRQALTAGAS
jgi:PadR family transcriptional regulator PadR